MNLTQEERQIVVNLLSQISIPINQAPVVLEIIRKLQEKEEIDKKKD